MPKVTMIPATINPLTHLPKVAAQKRRVAGYARVSTDSDEQFTSYEAQVDYYTKFIQSKPEWDFVKVYTDEGISGCNTKSETALTAWFRTLLPEKSTSLSQSRSADLPGTPWTVWSPSAS